MTGKRSSVWLVARRCAIILERVRRGPPPSWRDLLEAVEQIVPGAYGRATGRALHRRVANDLARLRKYYAVQVTYSRNAGGYVEEQQGDVGKIDREEVAPP